MIILSLSGKKSSGKNTVARMIADMTPSWCKEIAFADALKHEVAVATGTSIEFINKNKDNFRLILQGWGTDFRRKLHGDLYWISKLDKEIYRLTVENKIEILLVTDARFPNEVEYLMNCQAICINVVRPNSDKDQHISETANDQTIFDVTIQNDGTLQDLQLKVRQLVTKLGIKTR